MSNNYHPERAALTVIVLLPAIYLFYVSSPAWDTPHAATAFYSVLAFLCVTMAVSAMSRIRLDPSPSNNMMFSVTFYASLVFSGAASFYILSQETPVIHARPAGILLNLIALATTGIMILLYSRLDIVIKKENSVWFKRSTPVGIVAISITIFVLSMIAVRVPFAESIFLVAGYAVGIIAVLTYILAAILTFRLRGTKTANDPIRLSIAFILFAAAALNHMLILPNPSSLWIVSIALMCLAFILANVAISYTFLRDLGIKDIVAYLISIATSVLVLLPFLLSYLIDAMLDVGIVLDTGATMVIHFGGAVLAGLSAYSLYTKTKDRSYPGSSFIVFMLVFWAISESALVLSHLSPAYGIIAESLVPYICGSIVSAITLVVAVRRVYNPIRRRIHATGRLHLLGLLLAPILLIMGEFIRTAVLAVPGFPEAILGPTIMLAMSYLSLYALLTYILLEAGASGGKLTFDTIGAGLASVWVIVVILKVNFVYGSLGWWAAEMLMLGATAGFSALLLRFYLVESEKADTFIPRAAKFSSLLSDSILEHQSEAIDRLTELTHDSDMGEDRLDRISSILSDLSQANEQARYLQTVISGERFPPEDLETMDLGEAFDFALKTSGIPDTARWNFGERSEDRKHLVRANSLLNDLFVSLIRGISKRIGTIDLAEIDIAQDQEALGSYCRVSLDMIVKVEDIDEAVGLMRRYTAHTPPDVIEISYMVRLVDLFGGTLKWKVEIASHESLFIHAAIRFPQANADEELSS